MVATTRAESSLRAGLSTLTNDVTDWALGRAKHRPATAPAAKGAQTVATLDPGPKLPHFERAETAA